LDPRRRLAYSLGAVPNSTEEAMAKGQEKPKKNNKPKMTTKEKQKKKKEKSSSK
jgi:hypothetical protein